MSLYISVRINIPNCALMQEQSEKDSPSQLKPAKCTSIIQACAWGPGKVPLFLQAPGPWSPMSQASSHSYPALQIHRCKPWHHQGSTTGIRGGLLHVLHLRHRGHQRHKPKCYLHMCQGRSPPKLMDLGPQSLVPKAPIPLGTSVRTGIRYHPVPTIPRK